MTFPTEPVNTDPLCHHLVEYFLAWYSWWYWWSYVALTEGVKSDILKRIVRSPMCLCQFNEQISGWQLFRRCFSHFWRKEEWRTFNNHDRRSWISKLLLTHKSGWIRLTNSCVPWSSQHSEISLVYQLGETHLTGNIQCNLWAVSGYKFEVKIHCVFLYNFCPPAVFGTTITITDVLHWLEFVSNSISNLLRVLLESLLTYHPGNSETPGVITNQHSEHVIL